MANLKRNGISAVPFICTTSTEILGRATHRPETSPSQDGHYQWALRARSRPYSGQNVPAAGPPLHQPSDPDGPRTQR